MDFPIAFALIAKRIARTRIGRIAGPLSICVGLFVLIPIGGGQEPDIESRPSKLLRIARSGSPVVRPQAARRLIALGTAAAEVVHREALDSDKGLAWLGTDVIEVLGQLGDDRIRHSLWTSVVDVDFPWRPAAARSLAQSALPAERSRFDRFLADPLASVRVAGLEALEGLGHRREKAVRKLLEDPDDRVRRSASRLLAHWGKRWALAWPLEELGRDDSYFEIETGTRARFAAIRLLGEFLGDSFGYRPEKPHDTAGNLEAIRKLRSRWKKQLDGPVPRLPHIARAAPRIEGAVIGLEVRSCRRGEFSLRWTDRDELLIGKGNPRRIGLREGSVAELRRLLPEILKPLGNDRLWGEPGCDTEAYRWRRSEDAPVELFLISKGAKAQQGLRPEPLRILAERLLATLPSADGADHSTQTDSLRADLEDALRSVGGRLSGE